MATTAIYARYSSDLQTERSIDDQVAACTTFAGRLGLDGPFATFADRGLSGASMATRDQLQALLALVRGRRVHIVVSEALDRLSRDQADIAIIHRTIKAAGARLLTISEGEVDALHIGLKGTMNQLFLEELARKTRRGLIGVAKEGRIAGGRCFGYRAVPGRPGEREIDEAEAAIVRRIFAEYLEGRSVGAIAARLNAEGVPAPRGGLWAKNIISGDARAGDGVLCNELYRGRLVFNRRRFRKDPETGRRSSTLNPPSEWVVVEVPHLAIIDAATWERARSHRRPLGPGEQPQSRRRPKRLLSGLLRCGQCGGAVTVVTGARSPRLGCTTARDKGACQQRASVRLDLIERRVLDGLRAHLLSPELVAEAVRAYHDELRQSQAQAHRRRAELDRDLAEAQRKARRLAEKVLDSDGPQPTLHAMLREAEARIAAIEAELVEAPPPSVVTLHPAAAESYRAYVETFSLLADGAIDLSPDATAAIRDLIDAVTIAPDADARDGWAVTVDGLLAAILAMSAHEKTPATRAGVLAGDLVTFVVGAGARSGRKSSAGPRIRFAA